MRMEFNNNAKATLTAALTLGGTSASVDSTADFNIPDPTRDVLIATITNPGTPLLWEVVHIVGASSGVLTLKRGMEGTALEWPAGSQIGCRVTAGMLRRFAQADDNLLDLGGMCISAPEAINAVSLGGVDEGVQGFAIGYGSFAAMAQSRDITQAWVIGGYPVLQFCESPGAVVGSVPFVGTSHAMDLGVPPVWMADATMRYGDVVQPTTGGGIQFRLDFPPFLREPNTWYGVLDSITTGATEPTFPTTPGQVTQPFMRGGGSRDAYWHGADLAAGVYVTAAPTNARLYLDEVGFICDRYSASSAPVVSIGTPAAPTLFANNVTLSNITAAHTRHRLTVPQDVGASFLQFTLNTAASGGTVHGRFYWRGIIAQTPE